MEQRLAQQLKNILVQHPRHYCLPLTPAVAFILVTVTKIPCSVNSLGSAARGSYPDLLKFFSSVAIPAHARLTYGYSSTGYRRRC